jgi:PAS domain S-box-containing protein
MNDSPALHASTFQALFETSPDAMIVVDAAGRIALANPQAERLFGYAPMVGMPVETLVPDNARTTHHKHRANYVAHPRVRPMGMGQELAGQRADGSRFPVEIALSPIQTVDGHFYVASIRDISETQRARQALVRARYDALVATIGRQLLESPNYNKAFEGIPGLVAQEIGVETVAIVFIQLPNRKLDVRAATGMTAGILELIAAVLGPDTFPGIAPMPVASLENLPADAAEPIRALLRSAQLRDFAVVPLFDRGRPMGALVALVREDESLDRDKLHLLQSVANLLASTVQRSRTEDQLAHSQRLDAVGQLTGGIAHDFNNLLTVISGNLQLLEAELTDRPETQETLGSAMRAVNRGAELTRKLLATARRQRLNPQTINPQQLLDELIPMLSRTLGETVEVKVDCAPGLPNVLVDPGELDTAILNLAINARDAMPRGGALTIGVREQLISASESGGELAPGPYVLISVRDTGLGMPSEVLARAFEPFFTTKEIGRGSGLGLSMVYGFAKQSGGHVTADSRLGYGTCIEIYLPAILRPASHATAAARTPSSSGRESVLVVEDESEVRSIAVAFLRSLGYTTYAAGGAEEALQILREHTDIGLLFSDVILGSGMSGIELAGVARELRPGLPTLLTSGYEHPALSPDAPEAAQLPLLRKPYRREELAAAVRQVLDGSL